MNVMTISFRYVLGLSVLALCLVAAQCAPFQKQKPKPAAEVNQSAADSAKARQLAEEGRQYYNAGNYDMAIVSYGLALEEAPNMSEAYAGLAKTYEALGIDELAERNYQRAGNLEPETRQALQQFVDTGEAPASPESSTSTPVTEPDQPTQVVEVQVAEETIAEPEPAQVDDMIAPDALEEAPSSAQPAHVVESPEAVASQSRPKPEPQTRTKPKPQSVQNVGGVQEIQELPTVGKPQPAAQTQARPQPQTHRQPQRTQPQPAKPAESQTPQEVVVEEQTVQLAQADRQTDARQTMVQKPSTPATQPKPKPQPQVQSAPSSEPMDFPSKLDQADQYRAEGNRDAAIRTYLEILARDRQHETANREVTVLLLDAGGSSEVLPFARTLVELNPADPSAWRLLATAQERARQYPQAIESLRHVEELGQLTLEDRLAIARLLARTGKIPQATQQVRQVVKQNPTARSQSLLGSLLLMQQQWGEAQKPLEAALAQTPRDVSLLNKLGLCMSKLYQSTEENHYRQRAVDYWQRSLKIDPDQPNVEKLLRYYANNEG